MCCWWNLALPCSAAYPPPDEALHPRQNADETKQEVRAAVLVKLAVRPSDILWDVGAGTGTASAWRWRWPPLRARSTPLSVMPMPAS